MITNLNEYKNSLPKDYLKESLQQLTNNGTQSISQQQFVDEVIKYNGLMGAPWLYEQVKKIVPTATYMDMGYDGGYSPIIRDGKLYQYNGKPYEGDINFRDIYNDENGEVAFGTTGFDATEDAALVSQAYHRNNVWFLEYEGYVAELDVKEFKDARECFAFIKSFIEKVKTSGYQGAAQSNQLTSERSHKFIDSFGKFKHSINEWNSTPITPINYPQGFNFTGQGITFDKKFWLVTVLISPKSGEQFKSISSSAYRTLDLINFIIGSTQQRDHAVAAAEIAGIFEKREDALKFYDALEYRKEY